MWLLLLHGVQAQNLKLQLKYIKQTAAVKITYLKNFSLKSCPNGKEQLKKIHTHTHTHTYTEEVVKKMLMILK